MRTFLRPLAALCCLSCGWIAANAQPTPAEPSAPGANASRVRQAVREKLPKFTPPAPAPAETPPANALPPLAEGEELLVLPEFRVREKKVFEPSPDAWLTGGELTRKAIRLAERDMNGLELALNRWHIPLLTPSFAARAHATYEQQRMTEELTRLQRIAELGEKLEAQLKDTNRPNRAIPATESIRLTLDLNKRRN